MSYLKLDIENLRETREKVRKVMLEQDKSIEKIKSKVEIDQGQPNRSRNLFSVDSGFNTAYETSFTLFKAAVVDENIIVNRAEAIYLFHVDNYQVERFKRLLMQQILYEALSETVETGAADGSLVLVDGTITLTILYPTLKDSKEYKQQFKDMYEYIYCPLVEQCLKRDILLLGFLKRTGSRYLARRVNVSDLYDISIMNGLLQSNGQYIPPISVIDTHTKRAAVHNKYVTFYLNLKGWNYRFELLEEQEEKNVVCVENLMFWATNTNYGMNPIFSKADEYARVTKKEANLKFNYIIHDLSEKDKTMLRLKARKRTHFGYMSRRLSERLTLI